MLQNCCEEPGGLFFFFGPASWPLGARRVHEGLGLAIRILLNPKALCRVFLYVSREQSVWVYWLFLVFFYDINAY